MLFGVQQEEGMKYLGVCLMADRKLKCDVDHLKAKYYKAFNCLYAENKAGNSELVTVQLMRSYCFPFLRYASESLHHRLLLTFAHWIG